MSDERSLSDGTEPGEPAGAVTQPAGAVTEPAGGATEPGGTATGAGPDGGALMAAEIAEQPAVLARLLARSPEFAECSAALARRACRFVLIAARGSSDHAALYAKYLVEIKRGLPAGLVSPSSMTLYGSRPDLSQVMFVAVSQSGASPDLAESLAAARSCGATTVAVTNAAGSPLAGAAEFSIDLAAGRERAVAATKTYTAELLGLYLLLVGMWPTVGKGPTVGASPADAGPATLDALPEAAEATLARSAEAYAAAARYRFASRLITTGRGYSYPSALEGALKLMETSYLSAHAFSSADLLHGPLAMVDSEVPVIAFVSPGAGGRAAVPVVDQLRGLGADVLVVGGSAGPDGLRVDSAGVPEELLPVLEIMPLQQLAWRLARSRGEDPDRPRGLAKVTRTR